MVETDLSQRMKDTKKFPFSCHKSNSHELDCHLQKMEALIFYKTTLAISHFE